MGRPINRKIERLLQERDFDRNDLAKSLGITGQNLQDILKGRTAVNVQVLKGLVRFFGLRADYWVDDGREDPTPGDLAEPVEEGTRENLERLGLEMPRESGSFKEKVQAFIRNHPEEWATQFGPLTREELELLEGLGEEKP